MKTSILGVIALTTMISACTTTEEKLPSIADLLMETTGQNGRACIDQPDIQGYGVLEDQIISIDTLGGYYLATVLPGCIDLMTSIGVAFQGDFGEVCGVTSDSIITNDSQCTINQIYEFESRDEAFATYNAVQEKREELRQSAED